MLVNWHWNGNYIDNDNCHGVFITCYCLRSFSSPFPYFLVQTSAVSCTFPLTILFLLIDNPSPGAVIIVYSPIVNNPFDLEQSSCLVLLPHQHHLLLPNGASSTHSMSLLVTICPLVQPQLPSSLATPPSLCSPLSIYSLHSPASHLSTFFFLCFFSFLFFTKPSHVQGLPTFLPLPHFLFLFFLSWFCVNKYRYPFYFVFVLEKK